MRFSGKKLERIHDARNADRHNMGVHIREDEPRGDTKADRMLFSERNNTRIATTSTLFHDCFLHHQKVPAAATITKPSAMSPARLRGDGGAAPIAACTSGATSDDRGTGAEP